MNEKPDHLYHGSCAGIDGDLTPRSQHGDANGAFPEGPQHLVFATDDKNMVMGYTMKTRQMFSVTSHGETNIFLFSDHDGWKDEIARSECAIYTLSSDSFEPTLVNGKPSKEWKSKENVSPLAREHITPEDVQKTGGQLLFLPPEIDRELWNGYMDRIRDKPIIEGTTGAHFLREIQDQGLLDRHLNMETGIKPLALPKSNELSAQIKDDVLWLKDQVAAKKAAQIEKPCMPPPANLPSEARMAAIESLTAALRALRGGKGTSIPRGRDRNGPDTRSPA